MKTTPEDFSGRLVIAPTWTQWAAEHADDLPTERDASPDIAGRVANRWAALLRQAYRRRKRAGRRVRTDTDLG